MLRAIGVGSPSSLVVGCASLGIHALLSADGDAVSHWSRRMAIETQSETVCGANQKTIIVTTFLPRFAFVAPIKHAVWLAISNKSPYITVGSRVVR